MDNKNSVNAQCICSQGGRSWQPSGEGKNGHKKFSQSRISYLRDKCVVFASNCKFANLIQYIMQYIPCNSDHLARETLFLPKVFQKVRKSRRNSVCQGSRFSSESKLFGKGPSCLPTTSATLIAVKDDFSWSFKMKKSVNHCFEKRG